VAVVVTFSFWIFVEVPALGLIILTRVGTRANGVPQGPVVDVVPDMRRDPGPPAPPTDSAPPPPAAAGSPPAPNESPSS